MDELNVHQFWGISPSLDLLAAAAAAKTSTGDGTTPAAILQICPYDCRHTLATISHHISQLHVAAAIRKTADSTSAAAGTAAATAYAATADAATTDEPATNAGSADGSTAAATAHTARAAAATADAATADAAAPDIATAGTATADAVQLAPYPAVAAPQACSSSTLASQQPPLPPQQPHLQLYVYEAEPEGLARHMLLLSVLFDHGLTVQERAEMFLELHGNVLLRQKTADYLGAASKTLEEAVAQLSLLSAPAATATAAAAAAATTASKTQQQQQADLGVLQMFDLSLLKYQERDALLETFQKYQQKVTFDMSKAWDDRCRKWYADRYDVRNNLIDWDYHMRLTPRGTPFLDPALGSIIHFFHFRHWRLTGIAHELRGSAYVSANMSLLSTAYGRTKEFKDRQLRDVGRSVSAFGYWGDVLNSPYHCFGTVANDPGLFKVANKQFIHTAVDVAEHNILGFLQQIRSGCQPQGAAAAAGDSSSSSSPLNEAHRANAARGPTSMENLTDPAASNSTMTDEKLTPAATAVAAAANGAEIDDEAPVAEAQHQLRDLALNDQQQQQHLDRLQQQKQQIAGDFRALQALEATITQLAIAQLVATTKVYLLCGDLKRNLTGKSKYAQYFTVATIGHRHVHLLSPECGLAKVLKPKGLVFTESGQSMVQLNHEQVNAFEDKVIEMAAAGGFIKHTNLSAAAGSSSSRSSKVVKEEEKQQGNGLVWRLPPGHIALQGATAEQQYAAI